MFVFPQFNQLKQCRHGMMLYNPHDLYVGRSLDQYGEFSEGEVHLFRQLLKPGQVVLDIGANIGVHTVVLAQLVGRLGRVLAFEPQRIVYQTLCANLALSSITNVDCFHAAVGGTPGRMVVPRVDYSKDNNFGGIGLGSHKTGEMVRALTIDGLNLSKCDFVKVDVEGMEQEVLEGAVRSIAALWPALYVENDRKDKSESLIRFIDRLGYNMYWHTPRIFNPHNFNGNLANVFGTTVSRNMLCLPKRAAQQVVGLKGVRVPVEDKASPPLKPEYQTS